MRVLKYVVLDVEWNQKEKGFSETNANEIIQLAARVLDWKLNLQKVFGKLARPKDMRNVDDRLLKFMHLRREYLETVPIENIVIREFVSWIPETEMVLIVWNEQSVSVLKEAFKRCEQKFPFKKVIVLQEVMREIHFEEKKKKEQKSFRWACEKLRVNIEEKKLHDARVDAHYLSKLFVKFCRLLTVYDGLPENVDKRYMVKNNSNKIHVSTCPSLKNLVDMKLFGNLRIAILEGNIPCKLCIDISMMNAHDAWLKEPVHIKNECTLSEEYIKEACDTFKFKTRILDNKVFITTNTSDWYLCISNDQVTSLFHKSTRICNGGQKCRKDYHKQTLKGNEFTKVLRYIYKHDQEVERRKISGVYENKIDRLLRQVALERENREVLCEM